jgi:3-deoxy-D-manno-octulosonate 8-phosphate phosphatase KdsC-like HAD superfamily phosphatase
VKTITGGFRRQHATAEVGDDLVEVLVVADLIWWGRAGGGGRAAMNSDARSLLAAQAKEAIEFQGGEAAFREHALKHLRVKTVVKVKLATSVRRASLY